MRRSPSPVLSAVLPGALLAALLGAVGLLAASAAPSRAEERDPVLVYKSPTCGCCEKWVEHLEAHGFAVESRDVPDVRPLKRARGLAPELWSCHTALVGDYWIEGHVPAADVARLLAERPPIAGLAVPGMPIGSPGMEGPDPERYDVLSVDGEGRVVRFSSHGPQPASRGVPLKRP